MPASIARQIAFDILLRVETQGSYASDLLHNELSKKIEPRDAGLATELTMGVLRNVRLLNYLIESYSGKRIAALDAEVSIALRLGIYQIRYVARIPTRAAVNESIELVKRARKRSAAGFANAILRRAAEDLSRPVSALVPEDLPKAERLGILYSHPAWLVARWLERFGDSRTIALLEADNRAPETLGAFRHPDTREKDTKELEQRGAQIEPGRWLRDAFRVRSGNVSGSQAYRAGSIAIQDEASQMVPLMLGVKPGDSVVDLCAAPGGKTATLAQRAGSGAFVAAADLHIHRLRAMRAQLERLRQKNVHLVALDATQVLPFGRKFQRILVDAPCSGTGTLARNPEIRGRLAPEDLPQFHARQVAMLRSALECLDEGGRLVYSTCSLEPEENETVIDEVRNQCAGLRRVSRSEMIDTIAPHLLHGVEAGLLFDEAGSFRTFPPEHQTDGFFAAALERIG
jgi:16S rRNA (cytosine967-C5)-methyltransferase